MLGNALKNPVVWGGGALLGIILMLRSSPTNAQVSSSMDAVNPTITSASVAMNSAALGAQIQEAQIRANLGAVAFQADVTKQLGFYSLMKSIDENNATVQNTRTVSAAGITNNLITSSTAIIVDQANNANRLGLAYEETARAQITSEAQVQIAKLQASAAKAVSKNNMIGQIAGGAFSMIGNVAGAFGGI